MHVAMIIAAACAFGQAEPTDAERSKEVELW